MQYTKYNIQNAIYKMQYTNAIYKTQYTKYNIQNIQMQYTNTIYKYYIQYSIETKCCIICLVLL